MKRIITDTDDRIELTATDQRKIAAGLDVLRMLCRLAPQDGDTVGRAVQSIEAVQAAIVDGVYREPEASNE